jgi:hypothetical protein
MRKEGKALSSFALILDIFLLIRKAPGVAVGAFDWDRTAAVLYV